MLDTLHVECSRDGLPLLALEPATLDGSRIEVGGCSMCGGIWVAPEDARALFPAALLSRFAETGYSGEGPACGRCEDKPVMRSQKVDGVEIDRCETCLGLWLDGGELWSLGGGSETAACGDSCDVCGGGLLASSSEKTALGQMCGHCLSRGPLRLSKAVGHGFGMGGQANDSLTQRRIDGAAVSIRYDEENEGVYFEWAGELVTSPVRCTVGYETRFSRILRSVGWSDTEIGDTKFDDTFKISVGIEEPVLRWLSTQSIRDALWVLEGSSRAVVHVDQAVFAVTATLPIGTSLPLKTLEDACEVLYRSLREM